MQLYFTTIKQLLIQSGHAVLAPLHKCFDTLLVTKTVNENYFITYIMKIFNITSTYFSNKQIDLLFIHKACPFDPQAFSSSSLISHTSFLRLVSLKGLSYPALQNGASLNFIPSLLRLSISFRSSSRLLSLLAKPPNVLQNKAKQK